MTSVKQTYGRGITKETPEIVLGIEIECVFWKAHRVHYKKRFLNCCLISKYFYDF